MGLEPEPGELPPGYPTEYQREEVLRDGRQVFVRPILPGDAPELAEAIKTADADTLRRRFLGGPPQVTPGLTAHLTVVDYARRFALVTRTPRKRDPREAGWVSLVKLSDRPGVRD